MYFRFNGNYNSVYGGQSGDAFLALTGGCSEYIDFDDALKADADGSKMDKALAVHRRLKNACRQGDSMLTTEVPVCITHARNMTVKQNFLHRTGQSYSYCRSEKVYRFEVMHLK